MCRAVQALLAVAHTLVIGCTYHRPRIIARAVVRKSIGAGMGKRMRPRVACRWASLLRNARMAREEQRRKRERLWKYAKRVRALYSIGNRGKIASDNDASCIPSHMNEYIHTLSGLCISIYERTPWRQPLLIERHLDSTSKMRLYEPCDIQRCARSVMILSDAVDVTSLKQL